FAAQDPRLLGRGQLERWIDHRVRGDEGLRQACGLRVRELLGRQATRGRVVRIDAIVALTRPELVEIVPARHDHPVPLRRHAGDGARTAPRLDANIVRDHSPGHFLPPDNGLAMRHDALAYALEEIALEFPERLHTVGLHELLDVRIGLPVRASDLVAAYMEI